MKNDGTTPLCPWTDMLHSEAWIIVSYLCCAGTVSTLLHILGILRKTLEPQ